MSAPLSNLSLWLVGCGRMGSALLAGWRRAGLAPDAITILDPALAGAAADATHEYLKGITQVYDEVASLPEGIHPPDILVLGIKPQQADTVLPSLAPHVGPDTAALSIMAGITLERLAHIFGPESAIIRTMPNLPVTVERGITALVANANASKTHRETCTALMQTVGHTLWLKKEEEIDAITAISGSGPAYVYAFIEAMEKAATTLGLDPETSATLVAHTFAGSLALLEDAHQPAATLRKQVTSPGGTTEAALKVLQSEEGINSLVQQTVQAALDRARALQK